MIMPHPTVLQMHFVNRNGIFRNNLNNNDLHNPLIHMRDHLFHTAFVRLALVYSRLFAETERKIIEFFSLTMSFLALVILMYIHFVFVRTPTSCLENIQDRWPQDGILRVEILQKQSSDEYTLEKSYLKEKRLRQYGHDFSYLFHSDPIFREDAFKSGMKTYNYNRDRKQYSSQNDSVEENYVSDVSELDTSNNTNLDTRSAEQDSFAASDKEPEVFVWPEDEYIMEFSFEYGFLKLTPTIRKNLNITVELIILDPAVDKCFGGLFNQFILNNFLGYDEVLLASLKLLAAKEEYKGYVRNVVTEVEFIFVNIWMDRKSYITAGFVMMVFTVSISILLRYSHHQIFVFIVELLHMLEFHSSINFPAGPLLTVILALVGMEAIMSEFFNDTAVAFYVILIVWVADQYDAICCRTALSKRHWLRFFYLYHFFFYAYSYRFGHNRFLALLTSWLFTLHSMIFFFPSV